jgi:hypothetical protein
MALAFPLHPKGESLWLPVSAVECSSLLNGTYKGSGPQTSLDSAHIGCK